MDFLFIAALVLLLYLPVLNALPVYDCSLYWLDPALKTWDWRWLRSWYNRSLSTATIRATFAFVKEPYHLQTLHVTNALLHVVNSWLVGVLAGQLLSPVASFTAALLFAVCPLAVAPVAALAAGRSTLLGTTFGLLSVIVVQMGHPIAALFVLALAIHAREDSIAFLGVLVLTAARGQVYLVGVPLLLILAFPKKVAYILWHKTVANGDVGMIAAGMDRSLPQPSYTLTAITENLLVWPFWLLGFLQNPDPAVRATSWKSLKLSVCTVVMIVAGVVAWEAPGSARLALLLILSSPWVASWFFPLPDVVAENRAYSTIAGAAILACGFQPLAMFHLMLWLSMATLYRTWQRRHPIPYWRSAVRRYRPKLRVFLNVAALYQSNTQLDKAWDWHQKTNQAFPNNGIVLSNMGLWHEGQARLARAEAANDLVMFGSMNATKAQECAERAKQHLLMAIQLVSLGSFYCPNDPTVRTYETNVREHARLAGVIQ